MYSSQSYCTDHEGTRKGQQSGNDNRSSRKKGKEEEEKKEEEEEQSCSRNMQSPEVCIPERG